MWASLGLVEHWLGRASILLVALVALALVLQRSYRRFGPSEPTRGESGGEKNPTTGGRRTVLVGAAVTFAVVLILAAVLVGVYFGECPWVWDLTGAAGSLLELS